MQSIKVECPLFVDLSRSRTKDKRVNLSMNVIRNLNHFTQNEVKHCVKDLIWAQLGEMELPRLSEPVEAIFTIYKDKSRRFDLANFCSIIQKYVDDAVVEYGVLSDDSVGVIKKVTYVFGGYESGEGRCVIEYKEIAK